MLLTYQSLSFIAGVIDGAANPALDDNNDAGGANVRDLDSSSLDPKAHEL